MSAAEIIGLCLGVAGSLVSIGIFIGVTRTQSTMFEKRFDKLESRIENAVSKSDFPRMYAREASHHDGEE